MALALSEEGYQVYTAHSGDAALELLFPQGNGKRGSSQVDLAILDLMLPGVNGLDVCRLIRHGRWIYPSSFSAPRAVKLIAWWG